MDITVEEYLRSITDYNRKYLIGIDFDDTLSVNQFPKSADPGDEVLIDITNFSIFYEKNPIYVSVVDIIKHWMSKGDKFILWTCRTRNLYSSRDALQEAINWCTDRGLEFVGVNENHFGVTNDPRKILVDRIIDDNAINIKDFRNWDQHLWNFKGSTILDIIESGDYLRIRPEE